MNDSKKSWCLVVAVLCLVSLLTEVRAQTPPTGATPTFNRDVSRLLQARCQQCHRPRGIAPFPLLAYQDAFDHRFAILHQVETRTMPPWHVNRECVEYQNDPSLTDAEIAMLRRWLDSGAPEGDAADLPPPIATQDAWNLGEPDMSLEMRETFTPDFSKGDVYRCFILPTGIKEDRFVSAAEILPGSRSLVHHVILFIDTTGQSEQLDAAESGPGYTCFGGPGFSFLWTLGGWAPGNRTQHLPDGVGMYLPGNSRIVMQVHYSARSGRVEEDRSSIGLHFSKTTVHKRLLNVPVINTGFTIPAGAENYEVKASIPFLPFSVHVLGITPHMHLLGRKMTVKATTLNGREVCMVDVPDWDFHWQATYLFKQPIALPFGSNIELSARYDNSPNNPDSPNPPRDVSWGEGTTDEMCIAFLSLTLDVEDLAPGVPNPPARRILSGDPSDGASPF